MGSTLSARPRRKELLFWAATLLFVLFGLACCALVKQQTSPAPSASDTSGQRASDEHRLSEPSALQSPDCLYSCPQPLHASRNTILFREGFVLSNNPETKFADWVAYRITRNTIGKSKRRAWEADPELPSEETLEPEDFKGAHVALGTDRGHQVPLASFSGTQNWRPLNYLSNLTPQRSALNQQLWNRLEQAERKLVLERRAQEVFVVTGPLFEKESRPLPGADEPHRVPSGYFKVIAVVTDGVVHTASIVVSQDTPGSDSHCDHRVTVDEVEQRARLDLFSALPDEVEANIEKSRGALFEELGCR